jgi:hypothetical protein
MANELVETTLEVAIVSVQSFPNNNSPYLQCPNGIIIVRLIPSTVSTLRQGQNIHERAIRSVPRPKQTLPRPQKNALFRGLSKEAQVLSQGKRTY